MTSHLSSPQFMDVLRLAVAAEGGIRAFARKTEINQSIVCRVVNGTMPAPDSIVNALGYLRVTTFVQARPASPAKEAA